MPAAAIVASVSPLAGVLRGGVGGSADCGRADYRLPVAGRAIDRRRVRLYTTHSLLHRLGPALFTGAGLWRLLGFKNIHAPRWFSPSPRAWRWCRRLRLPPFQERRYLLRRNPPPWSAADAVSNIDCLQLTTSDPRDHLHRVDPELFSETGRCEIRLSHS